MDNEKYLEKGVDANYESEEDDNEMGDDGQENAESSSEDEEKY